MYDLFKKCYSLLPGQVQLRSKKQHDQQRAQQPLHNQQREQHHQQQQPHQGRGGGHLALAGQGQRGQAE